MVGQRAERRRLEGCDWGGLIYQKMDSPHQRGLKFHLHSKRLALIDLEFVYKQAQPYCGSPMVKTFIYYITISVYYNLPRKLLVTHECDKGGSHNLNKIASVTKKLLNCFTVLTHLT